METTIDTYVGGPKKPTIEKDPDALLDYSFDFTEYLAPDNDSIVSVLFVLEAGLTEEHSSHTPTGAVVWISGGVAGSTMRVTCRITTSGGRVDDRSVFLKIVER